jgi:hypothetical protein
LSLYFAAYIYIGIIATDWYISVNDYVVAVSKIVVVDIWVFKFISVVLAVSFIWFFIMPISNCISVKSVFSSNEVVTELRNDISVCNYSISVDRFVICSVFVVIIVFNVDMLAVKLVRSVFSNS